MALVYAHRRLDNNQVFYIGVGRDRARSRVSSGRSKHWNSIVDKAGYSIEIFIEDVSYTVARYLERGLIAMYGRKDLGIGNLVNHTDGGDGGSGTIISKKRRQAVSQFHKGRIRSEETRKKISASVKFQNRKSGAEANRSKKVFQYTTDGQFIREFASAKIASEATGCARSGISKVINGTTKTCLSFVWTDKMI